MLDSLGGEPPMEPSPSRRAMPTMFPVFPLPGALLLPQGRLPLNIFEPRYVAMIEDALAGGRVIGMIQPDARRPATANGPGLFGVGCLGRLSSFSETDDGRFLITLTGVSRFTVLDELEMRRGYRRVEADFASWAGDAEPDDGPQGFVRSDLLEALRAYFAARGIEANWQAIDAMDDAALVSTLSMVCPFDPAGKQALLEGATATDRADALLALLRIEAHDRSEGTPWAS